ncbi:MAG: AMP-binding protein [Actinomycetota bacterium]|nr:AMP-binding protein [Actinomycetota bacterium]
MDNRTESVSSATVNGLFQRAFRVYADRVAVTSEDGSITYRELGERAKCLAAALHGLGIRRGDRVAILSETRPEYIETYAALASLGVTALTLNIRLHADEIRYCVDSAKPVAVLTSASLTHLVDGLKNNSSITTWICFDRTADKYLDYGELLEQRNDPIPYVEVLANEIHNVLYTSGTTGRPKGAMISQGAAAVRGLRVAQWFGLGPEDGMVGWAPLFHCLGDESLYATMLSGGTYATLRKADIEMMFKMIERDRLSWIPLLPGVLTDFLNHPRRSEFDLSSLRFAAGYANISPRMVRELTATLGISFWDAFGQTETSYLVAFGEVRPGVEPSLRKTPCPLMEVRIVDPDMNETAPGVPGECLVRGPSVMTGYLDDPEASAEVFRGGWLHTGDVLVRHDDGTLTYVDRQKYLVKTGGENVYPAEVEAVIAQMESIQEVCVFGVPDDRWGETVKAVVVLRPGESTTAAEIAAWCRDRLAGFKRPHYIQFLTAQDLPRSTTGKLQRDLLAAVPVRPDEAI